MSKNLYRAAPDILVRLLTGAVLVWYAFSKGYSCETIAGEENIILVAGVLYVLIAWLLDLRMAVAGEAFAGEAGFMVALLALRCIAKIASAYGVVQISDASLLLASFVMLAFLIATCAMRLIVFVLSYFISGRYKRTFHTAR